MRKTMAYLLLAASLYSFAVNHNWIGGGGGGGGGPAPVSEPVVLVVYESANGVPEGATDKAVRDYVKTHFAIYRLLDRDADLSAQPKVIQDAMALAKDKPLPYWIVSNGRSGTQGPFPANALAVLQQYGAD